MSEEIKLIREIRKLDRKLGNTTLENAHKLMDQIRVLWTQLDNLRHPAVA